MNKDQLLEANQDLMARREAAREAGPKPIQETVATQAEKTGMTVEAYFRALQNNEPTGNASFEVSCSRERWEAFKSDRHPALQKAVKAIKTWYSERLAQGGAIVLAGSYGCGKTHLASAIHHLYGWHSVFWEEGFLIKAIQETFGQRGGDQSEGSIMGRIINAELFILDDLGSYQTDNMAWLQNIYHQIFNERCAKGKPILITTNLKMVVERDGQVYSPLEQRIGGRSYSRLLGALESPENFVDLFDVPDYRLRNFK